MQVTKEINCSTCKDYFKLKSEWSAVCLNPLTKDMQRTTLNGCIYISKITNRCNWYFVDENWVCSLYWPST